jgi:hypothetical protein
MTERSEVTIGLRPSLLGGLSPPDHDASSRSMTGRNRREELA